MAVYNTIIYQELQLFRVKQYIFGAYKPNTVVKQHIPYFYISLNVQIGGSKKTKFDNKHKQE